MSDYVICPATITSPAPTPSFRMLGLGPNERCNEKCYVRQEAPVMVFRCSRGHVFHATPKDIRRAG